MSAFKISPSILSANCSRLGEEVRAVDEAGADYIHVDVMDGHFVPNLTFGAPVVRDFRAGTNKPLDVHAEADIHLHRSLQVIRVLCKKAGVSLNPSTPETVIENLLDSVDLILVMSVNPGFGGQRFIVSQLEKIRRVRDMIGNRPIELEVDGGVNAENVASVIEAGANVIVAGSAIFEGNDYHESIRALREAINN